MVADAMATVGAILGAGAIMVWGSSVEAHVALAEPDLGEATELKERLRERFGGEHATIEVELSGRVRHDRALLQGE